MNSKRALVVSIAILLFISLDFSDARRASKKESRKPSILSNRVKKDIYYEANAPALVADDHVAHEDHDEFRCYDVLANDVDYENNWNASSLAILRQPYHGVAVVNSLTNKACYKPDANFHGHDSFTYSLCDKTDLCEWAEVRITVVGSNDAPTAVDDSATVSEDEYSIVIDVLKNDYDIDGPYVEMCSVRVVQQPCNGVVKVLRDRTIEYTPTFTSTERFAGTDSFIYQVCDNEDPHLCSYATVNIEVEDKCLACEKCNNWIPTFNDHAEWLDGYYNVDVLSHVSADAECVECQHRRW